MKRGLPAVTHSGGATLNLFTEADLDDMHMATLQALDRTGVSVEAADAIDLFADGGCRVDRDTHIVRIPPEVITRALEQVPSYFLLGGRDPDNDVMVEVGRVTAAPFAEGLYVYDLQSGAYRESTKQDVADICRVTDALEHIEINGVGVTARDMPETTAEIEHIEAALENTTKPIFLSMTSPDLADRGYEMAASAMGGMDRLREHPVLCYATCPVGPSVLTAICSDMAIATARAGMPWCCIAMDMSGASSPVTLAGTLVVQNCELLACLVLNQLVNPGNAFYYGTSTCAFDLRVGSACVGTPETALYQAGTAAMATYYGIPSWTAGY